MSQKLIFHVDMNAFFASCEQVIHPELKGKAIAVVGDPTRRSGIVLAASYEAKKYGIKTTMPIYQAKQCLPSVILVKSTYGLYSEMSKKVMKIFDDFTPLKEQLSIDEAYLDMTGTTHLFGDAYEAATLIQDRIYNELDLGCSVGVSSNKLLAKMASDMKKPMGITMLFSEHIKEKMWPLPVGELYGIGKKTVPKLHELGIRTIGDLAKTDKSVLFNRFGDKSSSYMHKASNGIGSDILHEAGYVGMKSVGNELTYSKDIRTNEEIHNEILLLADTVGHRLRRKLLKGRTLQVKIKFNDFKVITRSITFQVGTDSTDFIFEEAMKLVLANKGNKAIRLLGISLTNFDNKNGGQISLFDQVEEQKTTKVDEMVDSIRDKFGYKAIHRASILDRKHGKQNKR